MALNIDAATGESQTQKSVPDVVLLWANALSGLAHRCLASGRRGGIIPPPANTTVHPAIGTHITRRLWSSRRDAYLTSLYLSIYCGANVTLYSGGSRPPT